MKQTMKLWMLAAILTCGAVSAQAQETKHEIGISYGTASNSTVLSFLEDLVSITATAGGVKYDNEKNFGPIAVEYFYHLAPKVGVGAVGTYVNTKKDILIGGSTAGDVKVNYFSVMPAVKLGWFEKEHVGMYSKLAAGVTFRSEKQKWTDNGKAEEVSESGAKFNFQASLVGIEAGSKAIRGFAELGFGEQGVILAGLRYKF